MKTYSFKPLVGVGYFFVILALIIVTQPLAEAQQESLWKPTKPMMLIVPSRPGGGHDVTARVFAKYAQKYAGRPLVIVNEEAGAGVVAYTKVLQAKPDGYTIGQMSISLVSDQYLLSGAKYNHESFTLLCQNAEDVSCLVVKKGGPYDKGLEDFIAEAKQNPKKVRMGVSGNWTNHDYVREQIEMVTGAKFQRVSIKGGAQIVMAILAGDLDSGVPYPSEVQGQVDAGEMKILAHTGSQRLAQWPDVPTFREKGLAVDLVMWRILSVPKNTPPNIVRGLSDIFKKTMEDPELKKAYKDAGIGYAYKGMEDTIKLVRASHDKYKEIIDKAGLKKN
ncbi:MAG: tripartite tricarboxylate transporter substrate binding protein [Deltaproteobacteria bacterium]